MLTKDLAICIRAVDYSETSQVVTFFTRAAGKIGAIAKGSKRPKSAFDGPIEIFAHGQIVFSDSNKEKLATLTEFQQQPALRNLHGNLYVLYCCLFATELLNNLTHDYDPHPGLFESFLEFLQNANEIRDALHASRDTLVTGHGSRRFRYGLIVGRAGTGTVGRLRRVFRLRRAASP